jgi:serine/threonine protein kinase
MSRPLNFGNDLRDYHVGRLIGKGGFSHVFEAVHRSDSQRVALKIVRDTALNGAHLM